MPPAFISPEKFQCMSGGRKLPDNLTQDVFSQQNDFELKFTFTGIDLSFKQNHQIWYSPESNEDILRVKIDNGIQIRLYNAKDVENSTQNIPPLASSHDRLGNNVHELAIANLNTDRSYIIELIFNEASEMDNYADVEMVADCTIASLYVKIGDSSTLSTCIDKSESQIRSMVDSELTTLDLKQADNEFKSLKMVAVSRKGKNGAMAKVETPSYTIQISDEKSDLEIVIDDSELIYGASITLLDQAKS